MDGKTGAVCRAKQICPGMCGRMVATTADVDLEADMSIFCFPGTTSHTVAVKGRAGRMVRSALSDTGVFFGGLSTNNAVPPSDLPASFILLLLNGRLLLLMMLLGILLILPGEIGWLLGDRVAIPGEIRDVPVGDHPRT